MKSTLYLKFTILYVIFGFVALFTVATLSSELTRSRLERNEINELYQQANILGSESLSNYFASTTNETASLNTSTIKAILHTTHMNLDASVWMVDETGSMLFYCVSSSDLTPPSIIPDFNPIESGSNPSLSGHYHRLLKEESISVIAPIPLGFRTPGYVLLHKSYDSINKQHSDIMGTIYTTLLIIYLLSFCILLAFHFLIYVPLRKISDAATQYASGNLSHEIKVHTHDEMGYLSASLNYMSSQLRDMEDYQKKFIGNISHDFRSPLTSINGYVTALSDGTIPVELQQKYFKIILFETERLTDLTKDLLSLNEFDTKELLLNKEEFELHEMIKRVANSFEGTCFNRKISIELLFISVKIYVYADKRKIQQVIYNLLDNAIKFSDSDSTVTIETTIVNDKIFLSVKDYGMGISKENINKIWDRFYKSDLSRGKDKKGTGLGLSIVKEIVQAHNEHINVISTEGVGTEFIFSLPRVRMNSDK